jgi:asparagine N-glycosylation enzyme membrane subunit Stt3
MKGLNWKTIILGFLVDIAATTVLVGILSAVVGSDLASEDSSMEQMTAAIMSSPAMLWGGLLIGCLCSVLGGYIAAGPEPQHALKNAVALAIINALLGLLMAGSYPAWYSLVVFPLTFLSVLLGGYLRSRRQPRDNRVLDATQPPIPRP